jgi:hypothetical protein
MGANLFVYQWLAKLTTQQYVTQWLKFVRNMLESSYYIMNINIRLKRTIIQGPLEEVRFQFLSYSWNAMRNFWKMVGSLYVCMHVYVLAYTKNCKEGLLVATWTS